MSTSVHGTVGREVADLSWNAVTKGKRSRKAMGTSSESPKRVGDFSGSDLKKMRSPSSKSPTLSGPEHVSDDKLKDMDDGASKLNNGVFYSPDHFHGLSLLAAAACINTTTQDAAVNGKAEQNAGSESGKQLHLQQLEEISADLADVSSTVDRLHWDLNVPMEEWGKPDDSSTFAVQTTSLDEDDGVTVSKEDEESDAETVVLDLDQVVNAEECCDSKSSEEDQRSCVEENHEEEVAEEASAEKVAEPEESDKDGLKVCKDDEESDAETVQLDVDLDLVENAEECCVSKPSEEELNHEENVETSKEVAEPEGTAVSGDRETDVEAVPPVDQAENAEENQNFNNVGEGDTVEASRNLAEPPEGSYESLSEEGELKGSMSNSWQENEHVDYESEEFCNDMSSVHGDADGLRSPRKWRESENNDADDDGCSAENILSNQGSAPNFRDERDDRYSKGNYKPDFRGRGRYHPYQSGCRGRGRGPNRPRMSGPHSRDKFDQKPHHPYHPKRDDRYGEGDRNRQMTYWEPPMEENGHSRSRSNNNGEFNKHSMEYYPSKNMHRPVGWNGCQNDRRNFRGGNFSGYNNGGGRGRGFQKPSFADDYEDGYRSPPPPPAARGRFSSPPRSFRGDQASFRKRVPPYNNGFRQDQRLDSGEGFKSEDGSYIRNRRAPFKNGFRAEQGGYKSDESFRPDW